MLLDRPGRYLYKHHVNLYPAMRALCSDYRYLVCGFIVLACLVAVWLLTRPTLMEEMGIVTCVPEPINC